MFTAAHAARAHRVGRARSQERGRREPRVPESGVAMTAVGYEQEEEEEEGDQSADCADEISYEASSPRLHISYELFANKRRP